MCRIRQKLGQPFKYKYIGNTLDTLTRQSHTSRYCRYSMLLMQDGPKNLPACGCQITPFRKTVCRLYKIAVQLEYI